MNHKQVEVNPAQVRRAVNGPPAMAADRSWQGVVLTHAADSSTNPTDTMDTEYKSTAAGVVTCVRAIPSTPGNGGR
jgi:hypothetical protein